MSTSKKGGEDSAPFHQNVKGTTFMMNAVTAGDLRGILKALKNMEFVPEGSGSVTWSPNNVKIQINLGTRTTAVFVVVADDGSVRAVKADVPLSNVVDYTP